MMDHISTRPIHSGDPAAMTTALLPGTEHQDRVLERPGFWKRNRRRMIIALAGSVVLLLLLLALSRFVGVQESVSRSSLTIATVERGSFSRDIVAAGQVVATVSPTLHASAAGIVTLEVHAGDPVAKEQPLAVIDSPDLKSKLAQEQATLEGLEVDARRTRLEAERRLAQLRASYEQAQIDRRTAEREAQRSRKAYELGAYTELQVSRAEDALEKAQFADDQAKAAYQAQPDQNRFEIQSKQSQVDRQKLLVEDLLRQVDALQVRSPVNGRVGQVLVGERASVLKDTPLITVVDLSALEVEINVPETLARDLASGAQADLEGGGRHWAAVVSAVSPQVVNGEVVARLRLNDSKPEGLRQNQRLTARILLDRRENVLMVDRGLFVEQDGGGFAYVVNGNIAERRRVRLGAMSVGKVEILGGLAAGDRVVISGTDIFHGAQRIRLAN
jgi:HlyD family secretion protein